MNRRTASGMIVVGGSLFAATAIGLPAVLSGLSPAFRTRLEDWRPLGPLSNFPIGSVSLSAVVADRDRWPRALAQHSVFVWRQSEDALVVFSRSCTDLGCPLDFDRRSGCYLCPCHGGIFDQDGSRLAGPPKSNMHRYAHRLRDDLLEIDLSSIPPSA